MTCKEAIKLHWPTRWENPRSRIAIGKVADTLRFRQGLTYNHILDLVGEWVGNRAQVLNDWEGIMYELDVLGE